MNEPQKIEPTQDEQYLQLLSIFHYIVGGITGLLAMIPLIHLAIGILMLTGPDKFQPSGMGEAPPPALGWVLITVAAMLILLGWTLAGCIIAAGRCLAKRKRYVFCLTMAGIECLLMPFGTVLGVFSIIVLTREPVKAKFQPAATNPVP